MAWERTSLMTASWWSTRGICRTGVWLWCTFDLRMPGCTSVKCRRIPPLAYLSSYGSQVGSLQELHVKTTPKTYIATAIYIFLFSLLLFFVGFGYFLEYILYTYMNVLFLLFSWQSNWNCFAPTYLLFFLFCCPFIYLSI